MNVYQKILVKLYEATDGKDSVSVDFKELVKKEGFLPSYIDIFKQMSQQGWIAESGRSDVVNITHWGVKEAKKSQLGTDDSVREVQKNANRLKEGVRELLVMTEEFTGKVSEENFDQVKGKFDEIKEAIDKLNTSF